MKREELLKDFEISRSEPELTVGEISKTIKENQQPSAVKKNEIVIEQSDPSQISVYGKPSIYIPTLNQQQKSDSFSEKNTLNNFQYFNVPVILKYISNFFKWKYMENNLYIYRESFFTDFFRDDDDLKESLDYCNEELIFAICASGSKIDFDDDVFLYKGVLYDSPEKFYNRARYLVFQKLHTEECNSITSIQTFLCLAFFDLGKGRILSAWVLAGIAFRIGMHMGFELNLNYCQTKENENEQLPLTDYDMNVKCRIYWGCLIADYYISFILGRSPTLEHLHTTIPQSKDLPLLPGIDFFLYYDPLNKERKIFNISRPLERLNALYKLVNKYHKLIYQNTAKSISEKTQFQVSHNLGNFNVEVYEWKAKLSDDLYWTKAELKTTGYNPNLMFFRHQYYMVLLSFNRDFVDIDYEYEVEISTSPRNICRNCIEDVYTAFQCFNSYHSFKFASLNMVYLSILCISILQKLPESTNFQIKRSTMIDFFALVLKESSSSWDLAKNAYMSFIPFLKSLDLDHHQEIPEKVKAYQFIPGNHRPEEETADFDESLIPSLNYG
jgi:hypothetical protein